MQYLNPQTQWGISIRDVLLRVITGLRVDKIAMAGVAMMGFTEKKLARPKYEWPEEEG